MSDNIETNDERPCLHCLIGDVIDDFYAEYGSLTGEKDAIDVVPAQRRLDFAVDAFWVQAVDALDALSHCRNGV